MPTRTCVPKHLTSATRNLDGSVWSAVAKIRHRCRTDDDCNSLLATVSLVCKIDVLDRFLFHQWIGHSCSAGGCGKLRQWGNSTFIIFKRAEVPPPTSDLLACVRTLSGTLVFVFNLITSVLKKNLKIQLINLFGFTRCCKFHCTLIGKMLFLLIY